MPNVESPQKAFYDTRRQFQGNDDPSRAPQVPIVPAGGAGGIPIGQLIAGAVFLALIVVAFFAFALPQKLVETPPAGAPAAAAPAHK